jgi:FixJ family two-component response regulator
MKPDRSVSVVDDEESIREAIDALLRSVGFQVAAFASAEEFLGAEALGRTACLILDLRIPGMDGLQLQQRLRLDGHEFSIIILTANESADDRA